MIADKTRKQKSRPEMRQDEEQLVEVQERIGEQRLPSQSEDSVRLLPSRGVARAQCLAKGRQSPLDRLQALPIGWALEVPVGEVCRQVIDGAIESVQIQV